MTHQTALEGQAMPDTQTHVIVGAGGAKAAEFIVSWLERGRVVAGMNVTMLFAVESYEQAIEAYLRGLERRARAGKPLAGIASVASFFVSRVDAKADARLSDDSPLRGKLGIANARAAYAR
jgi:transaldolase